MHLARPQPLLFALKRYTPSIQDLFILSPYLVGIQHPNPFLNVYKKWAGAGAILLDSSLIPSPPIMPQDRARVDGP